MRGTSDRPMGRVGWPSQNTRGQRPKSELLNLSSYNIYFKRINIYKYAYMYVRIYSHSYFKIFLLTIFCIPRLVIKYLAWISPYNTSAAVSNTSCCSSVNLSIYIINVLHLKSKAQYKYIIFATTFETYLAQLLCLISYLMRSRKAAPRG